MLPFVDCVISVSSTMTEDFCRAVGYPKAKVRTIYLGVDDSFTKLDETDAWRGPNSYTASRRTFCFSLGTSSLIRTWKTCYAASG